MKVIRETLKDTLLRIADVRDSQGECDQHILGVELTQKEYDQLRAQLRLDGPIPPVPGDVFAVYGVPIRLRK